MEIGFVYADDKVIYAASSNTLQIIASLQSDSGLMQNWFIKNNLVNQTKSYIMLFGPRQKLISASDHFSIFTFDGALLD